MVSKDDGKPATKTDLKKLDQKIDQLATATKTDLQQLGQTAAATNANLKKLDQKIDQLATATKAEYNRLTAEMIRRIDSTASMSLVAAIDSKINNFFNILDASSGKQRDHDRSLLVHSDIMKGLKNELGDHEKRIITLESKS